MLLPVNSKQLARVDSWEAALRLGYDWSCPDLTDGKLSN